LEKLLMMKGEPHLRQAVVASDTVLHWHHISETPEVLHHKQSARRAFVQDSDKAAQRSVLHWGQRKLLACETQFFTRHMSLDASDLVVYAGAAPGDHMEALLVMFPHAKFVLFDRRRVRVARSDRVEVRREFFTDESASEFAGRSDVLFVSDIRTDADREDCIADDMTAQMRWTRLMRPRAALLKFRLPWFEGSTRYLCGELLLPIWGRPTTTECRLVVTKVDDECDYDNQTYWEEMAHFNKVTRVSFYNYALTESCGSAVERDHCFDCAAELLVLRKYLCRFGDGAPSKNPIQLSNWIVELLKGKG
jgi:cap2 methyltransferase